jgi:hypothetical protein
VTSDEPVLDETVAFTVSGGRVCCDLVDAIAGHGRRSIVSMGFT